MLLFNWIKQKWLIDLSEISRKEVKFDKCLILELKKIKNSYLKSHKDFNNKSVFVCLFVLKKS